MGLEWVWGLVQPGFVGWAPLLHKTTLTTAQMHTTSRNFREDNNISTSISVSSPVQMLASCLLVPRVYTPTWWRLELNCCGTQSAVTVINHVPTSIQPHFTLLPFHYCDNSGCRPKWRSVELCYHVVHSFIHSFIRFFNENTVITQWFNNMQWIKHVVTNKL